jgi:N-acetyl-S-(2-succino)cysteine monooxygenase
MASGLPAKGRSDASRSSRRDDEARRVFLSTGNHVAAWLHPEAQIDAGTNFKHYAKLAQTAERGKFDLMFLADALAVRDGKLAALSRWPQYMVYFDPVTLAVGDRGGDRAYRPRGDGHDEL